MHLYPLSLKALSAGLLAASFMATASANDLPSQEFLAQQGLTVVGPLPAVGGLKAWAAYRDQQPVPIYLMPDGKHWVLGTVIDAQGRDVNGQALQSAVQKPMGEQLWADVQRSQYVPDGKPNAPRTVYVFTDPNCPYCNQLWLEARPWVESGQVQLRHILVGILRPSSEGKAAAILSARSPEQALASHARAHAAAGRGPAAENAGIAAQTKISAAMRQTLANHAAMMSHWGLRATPAMIWKDDKGLVQIRTGMPPGVLEEVMGKK
ncbi:thiol:disulfide interchange protein DsbG [Comamonas composti]|uniref:thiol:disulfide interchange protein DsbG n=1 Tax=Comamonas composti TaxID=408558 RepID=UPI00042290B5|nr:thiol:disulfide interchange protein DsbG [Comamonas composti]